MRSHFFLLLQEKVLYEINKLIIDDSKEDVCFIFWLLLFSLNLVKRSVYDRNQVKYIPWPHIQVILRTFC